MNLILNIFTITFEKKKKTFMRYMTLCKNKHVLRICQLPFCLICSEKFSLYIRNANVIVI